ncbi:MAG: TAXI family TRAP transporter solute-binding subunit [Burkholderiales bacterium]
MARIIRQTLVSFRDLMATFGPFVLLAIVLLVATYYILDPAPPKRVVLATGPAQSDYAIFGERYAEELKPYGIEVVLRTTSGSNENQRLLLDEREDIDLAFMRGGANEAILKADEEEGDWEIESLGSLFYEPIWIFYRESAARRLPGGRMENLAQMRGWRVAIGAGGSGVPNLLIKLFHANKLSIDSMRLDRQSPSEAVAAFVQGKIDAVILASAPESPLVQMLLQTPGVRLFEFNQAEAYSRRFPYLIPVTLPRGMVDFARDMPPRDVPLLASSGMLVAREDTHPAVVQLFVQAATRIHGGNGWFVKKGQFPNANHAELPLAPEAERFYKNGVPFLQQHLPFWLSNLIDRMWVALFSIIAVLIPLSRVVPPLYAFRIRSRIFRWYQVLREIEDDLTENVVPRGELMDRVDRLEARAEEISVPLAYTDQLYALRSHIQMVRERLRQMPLPKA